MAPAIVHFLVGASLLLVLAAPFALRSGLVRRGRLWIVSIGGLWGLAPDLYNIAPVFRGQLRIVHDSSWADLFAVHYTLDQPPLADLYLETVFASILAFLVATAVVTVAGVPRENGLASRFARVVATVVCIAVAALLAGAVVGTGVYATGRLESVASLYGRESARAGIALLLAWSVLTGMGIDGIIAAANSTMRATDPAAGLSVGLLIAIFGWLFGIAIALPLWMRVVFDSSRPFPYLHWQSLIGLLVFGFVFGLCYPPLRRVVGPPPNGESGTRASNS
ncbi:hypothetical protein [Natronorubrum halophilum]|uniref:hypothetical protein n=1 Tax=Natronorubrum halophilum TaxID=1702106 RepID=UPI000EF71342|nr:hypothetical protein [Natronorubrum halophilum]